MRSASRIEVARREAIAITLAAASLSGAGGRNVEHVRRVKVDSSVILGVGYDAETAVLELEFTTGEVYRYFAVPPSVHRGLLDADSAGRYFAQRIRHVYPAEHVR